MPFPSQSLLFALVALNGWRTDERWPEGPAYANHPQREVPPKPNSGLRRWLTTMEVQGRMKYKDGQANQG